MLSLCKTLHVLAIGLWFGSVVFFTTSGVLIFRAFSEESRKPKDVRETWLPLPPEYEHDSPGKGFPDPLRLEQGSRAAGEAVGAVFPVYYGLQIGCGIVALLTAIVLARFAEGRLRTWRIGLCVAALATVGVGCWLERVVHEARGPRNTLTDAVLRATTPAPQELQQAREARAAFSRWHNYSLMQNFATLALATVLTVLAAHLPAEPRR